MPNSTPDRASALAGATARLRTAGIAEPRRDAERLLLHAEGIERAALIASPHEPLAEPQTFAHWVDRRARREPVSRITGLRAFWKHDFIVTDAVLDPRPDTETLVETALRHFHPRPGARMLDLGTGSGCILLSLLHERPSAGGIGTDVSGDALQVAKRNARRLHLADRALFVQADWCEGLDGTFDLVVSNPPYIPEAERVTLEPEVSGWDPHGALFAGVDGLQAYRRIARGLDTVLAPSGTAVLEFGAGQSRAVSTIFREAGFEALELVADIDGRDRCLVVPGRSNRPST